MHPGVRGGPCTALNVRDLPASEKGQTAEGMPEPDRDKMDFG
jgi:hypothetical protein